MPSAAAAAAPENLLIGLEPIEDIIKAAIIGGNFRENHPLSLMLVAPSGAGKSRTLLRVQSPSVYRCEDLTSAGLFDILKNDVQNKIRHILLPDFNPVLSHKASVTNLLLAQLLGVLSDGVMRLADGRQTKELKHDPIGLLTACTPELFAASHRRWRQLGLLRRILCVHYTYKTITVERAQTAIEKGKIKKGPLPPLPIPKNGTHAAPAILEHSASTLKAYSVALSAMLSKYYKWEQDNNEPRAYKRTVHQGEPLLPMSPHVILRAMAQGYAAANKHATVEHEDLDFVARFIDFTDIGAPVKL